MGVKFFNPNESQSLTVAISGVTTGTYDGIHAPTPCGTCGFYAAGGTWSATVTVNRVSQCEFAGCAGSGFSTVSGHSSRVFVRVQIGRPVSGALYGIHASVEAWIEDLTDPLNPCVALVFAAAGEIDCLDPTSPSLTVTDTSSSAITCFDDGRAGYGGSAVVTLTCNAPDPSTDCASTKLCVQSFTAFWDCDALAWTGPTAGAVTCGSPSGWVKTSTGATGCTYQTYVGFDPATPCSADAECSGGGAATPALPFGGLAPPDCCTCTEDCTTVPDPGCCITQGSLTPDFVECVIGGATQSTKCSFDGSGNVARADGSGLGGVSMMFTRTPGSCDYTGQVSAAALAAIRTCNGFPATGCGACTPTGNIISGLVLKGTWTPGSAPVFQFYSSGNIVDTADCSGGPFCGGGNISIFLRGGVTSDSFEDCCHAWSVAFSGPDGTEDWNTIFITSITMIPCGS